MKKLASIVIALSLFLVSVHATTSQGVDLTPSAKAAILIDYETGQILYEKNSSAKLYPASMTKMMSLLLVVEAVSYTHLDVYKRQAGGRRKSESRISDLQDV